MPIHRIYHRGMTPMPKPGPKAVAAFENVAEGLTGRGATTGKMFGMPVLKVRDKVFAGMFGDAMTFKLSPEDMPKALKLKGVEPFEPMPGRSMKGWVLVPLADAKRWPALAEKAWEFLS